MVKFLDQHQTKTYLRCALVTGMALLFAGCVVVPAEPVAVAPPPGYYYYHPGPYYAYPPYGPRHYYYVEPAVGIDAHIR